VRAMVAGELPDYRTLVIDTVDAAEALLFAHICEKEGVPTIGDVPYGRGYDIALDAWRELLAALEQLQHKRGMHVVLLGHSHLKTFKNPQGDDFDRYVVKMHEKAAAFLRERARGVYFANYETFADKDAKTKRVRGISTGARLLYTQRTAAYDAKDRYGLPEQLALDWNEFETARAGADVATEALKAEIERKAKQLGGEIEKFAREYLVKNATNAVQLNLLNTKLNAKLAEKAEQARRRRPRRDPLRERAVKPRGEAMLPMEKGRYSARAVSWQLGEAGTGTPQVGIEFRIEDGDQKGERISGYFALSDAAAEYTLQKLRNCGWRGTDISELDDPS
jgi:hypothetical protein